MSEENESGGGENDGENGPGDGNKEEESDGGNDGEGNESDNEGAGNEESGSEVIEQNETGNADHVESDETELKQETYTVTMPEYHAENVGTAEVKTLIGGVTWDSAPAYDADTAGIYTFTAAVPEGYTLAEGVGMPEIRVTVGENILLFLECAEALPDLDTVLEDAPGEGEEGYEAWEKCFLETVSEADSLKKAYDAFSETERAQIPQEIYANLMAWWAYGRVMEGAALYADIPAWGGHGYAPVRGNGGSGSAVYALGNNLTLKAGEGDKTKVYYMDSDAPIDLAHLEEDNGWNGAPFSFQGEGDVGSGFDLTNTGVVATITGTYYGYQNKGTTEAGGLGNVFSDMDVVIHIEGGTLSGLLTIYPNKYTPKSVTLYMTGGTWLGGSKVDSAIMANAAYVSGGCMKGSIGRWYNLYLSGSPVIGEEGGGLLMGDGSANSKFYLDGALSSSAAVYINPQKNFADGTVLAEGSGYTIKESDLAYLHLTGDNVAGKELQLKNNQVIITHIHELTYTAEGAIITESCENGCGHSETAALSLKSGMNLTYTGNEIKPVTVTYSSGWEGTGSKKPADTAIIYQNHINTGTDSATASLTIAGATANLKFSITPASISGAEIALDNNVLTYNGSEQTKKVNSVKVNGRTLTAGTDYTISGNKGTAAGTYTLTLTGKDNYTGTKKVDFTIAAKTLTASMISVASGPHYYTGSAVTPAVTVKDGSRTLTVGTDYTVSYEDNINAGTAKATVTGKGNYMGTASQTFTIQYGSLPAGKKLTDYVTVSPAPTDGWYDAEITLTPKSGCGVGETSSGIGSTGVTVSGETGADGTTKTIYVKDETGKIYQTEFTYKLDKTPPVIDLTGMSVTNGTKGLWNWIIGKKSMIIRIPETGITDALSGVKEVSYTAVSDSGAEQTRTIQVQGGSYDISMNAEFSGTIKLTAKDKAGNSTEVSLTAAGGKVIAEDYAPIVKMTLPVTPQPNKDGWYNTTVSVNVAVTDDKNADNAGILSGGIARIVWKDGENGAEQPVAGLPGASPVYEKEFTISVSTDGAHTYYVKAVDNAGNESGWRTIAVKRDTGNPVFTKAPEAGNHTQAGTEITFIPSEGGKAYWLVNPETTPAAQEVVRKGAQNNCVKESMTGGSPNSFKVTGLTPGKTHTVYVVLEDAAGNLSEVKAVSISIDKYILTDSQMNLSVSGWTYGAQEKPVPRGSVSVADANPVITYLYSADSGVSWTDAERLPKSDSGHIVPGTYQVKMTYTGDGYKGTKTAVFTVEKRPLTVEKGTLEAEDKNYDGTLTAALKEGGVPTLSGVLAGDMVSLGGTLRAEFVEVGPKKNIAVTVTGFELEGRDAGYYVIGNTSITLQATVNKADGTPPDEKKPESGDHDKDTDKDKDKDKDKGSGGGENSGGTNDNSDSTGNGGEAGNNDGADNGGSPTPVVSPKNPEKPSDMPVPAETDRSAPEQKTPKTGGNSDREPGAQEQAERQGDGKSGNAVVDTENRAGQDTTVTDNGGQSDSDTVRSVTATTDQGRIVVSGEKVPAGNVAGMEQASTAMALGDGTVFVTVVCEDEKYAAGVKDTAAVANAVLSAEQLQLVNDGEIIEIRVDVKDISEKVPQKDKEVIENGLARYREEVPALTLGRYVDISMFMKIGESDWDAITSTEEPIEVVIGVPEDMREDGREFYIIRAHEGEHTFMHDLDEEPDTITISTDMFSSYAIAYVATGGGNGGSVCGLCHICPTFLGVCCFIWLAVVTVVILFTAAVILRRKRKGKQTA